ncbi:hypothetical protein F5X97DRAFT_177166 [Nemania serpens]|nr:hypothetical protein F5X97DRAFT_177166 [Nemania serpens]
MATAAAAAPVGSVLKTFRTGTKKVFLPWHVVTLLAPRTNQPPTFATFEVPLTFNKFDLRDYLLHAYKTPVIAVRSQLRQQPVKRSSGRIHRPAPIKTMTVQLTKPFVWPRVPTDVKPWRRPEMAKVKANEEQHEKLQQTVQKTGKMPLRDELVASHERKELKREAKRLLREGGWTNKRPLDVRFSKPRKSSKPGKAKKS